MSELSRARETLRLFVAVNLEETVRRSIAETTAPLRAAERAVSWVVEPNLHLTFRFLRERPAELVPMLRAVLVEAASEVAAHVLELRGFGAFPSIRRSCVLWLGVRSNVVSATLYQKVDDACASLGLGREARDFHPHVTLGRIRPRATPTSATLGEAECLLDTTWTTAVTSVDLMSSRLGPDGARYERLLAVPLAAGAR